MSKYLEYLKYLKLVFLGERLPVNAQTCFKQRTIWALSKATALGMSDCLAPAFTLREVLTLCGGGWDRQIGSLIYQRSFRFSFPLECSFSGILSFFCLFVFALGSLLEALRGYFLLCILGRLGRPQGMPGIKPRSTAWKTNALNTVLLLCPSFFEFWVFVEFYGNWNV